MKILLSLGLSLVSLSVPAQISGVIKDSLSGLPIPYVSIWVADQNIAATAEEDGTFTIGVNPKSEKLVFSALGYARKTVGIAQAAVVKLNPIAEALDEVVILRRLQTKTREIGKNERQLYEAFESAPRIDVKYFPYLPAYKKTRFLKQLSILTDSKLDGATLKLHFYAVSAEGGPGTELLSKDFIVSVSKGVSATRFNLTDFNLQMPKDGLFVGFEKLMIESNRIEKEVIDPATKQRQVQITHNPFVLYYNVERDFKYVFSNGKWMPDARQQPDQETGKIKIYEPAITLTLTN